MHTDGVSPGGEGYDYTQAYKIDLGLRNAADLADWLLDHNLTKEQHTNTTSKTLIKVFIIVTPLLFPLPAK